jgi:hypothetical protein
MGGRIVLVTLLALVLAAPASAATDSALPISGFGVSSKGILSGTGRVGGVPGTLTSTATTAKSGSWSMSVGGVPFASGTYSCAGGGCTYVGTVVGSKTAFSFTTASSTASVSPATGFATHGGWVSTVGHWASANRGALAAAGLTVGDVVSAAAHEGKTQGKSGGTGTTASHDVAKGGAGDAHGGGNDHDGHGR